MSATNAQLKRMKTILREEEYPTFSDDDLQFYLEENNGDVNRAIYQCLLIKAEDSSISINGLSSADTSSYFKRLAQRYRPNNSGILKGI